MNKILDLYPFKKYEHEIVNNFVVVLYKELNPTFIEKLFFKKMINKPYKIDLDEIGSFIWLLCDGKNDVNKIIEISKSQFGEKIEPCEQRVLAFIEQLRSKKLIELYQKIEK
ncbi:MAG: PqqD family protein [bacterium]